MRPKSLKRIIDKVTTEGLRTSLRGIVREGRAWRLHRKGLLDARQFNTRSDLKLNLGCGNNIKERWINVDLHGEADLTLDLRERLPLPNGSCSIIYCEHFLEHLEYPGKVTFFLKESYRVLKAGGIFSVGVPDTEWPIRAYVEQEADYYRFAKERWHPKWCLTRMEHINYHFRQGEEHKFAYDYETLKHVLERSGFVQVRRRDYDPELDSEDRKLGTLYVDAIKPI